VSALGEKYVLAYDELLRRLCKASVLDGRRSYAAMWPMRGRGYRNGGFVIGRAVNGWDESEWRVRNAETAQGRRRIALRTKRMSEPHSRCPMSWIADCAGTQRGLYNSNTSAFWRTARTALTRCQDGDWHSELCWSNLYKVAPARGGNPSSAQREAQFPAAVKLLRMELDSFKPRRVLVLTGRSWFEPFEEPLGINVNWGRGSLVEGTAVDGRTTWVIAKHPQGKNERALAARARSIFRW
jgi:hypothetical protein